MARETKEQRIEREAHEALEHELEKQKYLKTLPKRLFEAQALAKSLGVGVTVLLSENGPIVRFTYSGNDYIPDGNYIPDGSFSYLTEEWEMDSLEKTLQTMKKKEEECKARRALAQSVFDVLTPEQKAAVKEHIHSLR